MKLIKKFENYMSREEMCQVLCGCGYNMSELEKCSNQELAEMCANAENQNSENSTNNTQNNTMTTENNSSMSRKEMCRMLTNNGYSMSELQGCSNQELAEMCANCRNNDQELSNNSNNNNTMTTENNNSMSREQMCRMLTNNGYSLSELEKCSNQELAEMCANCRDNDAESHDNAWNNNMTTHESKKWIQGAIKKPGSLRKSMDKKEGEKLTKSEIDSELQALKGKDKDKSKKGVQGLSKKDLTKYRRLNLAKTLKGLKEHQETQNYMFFGNLQTIKRLIDEMLEMDESKIDAILTDGHGWALDHIATSKDDIEEVFNFLASHDEPHHHELDHAHEEPSHEETEGNLANKDLEDEMKGIKSFNDFKK